MDFKAVLSLEEASRARPSPWGEGGRTEAGAAAAVP